MNRQLNLRPPRIFLSYAKEDKQKVSLIYRRLLAEKMNPWFDIKDLLPGQDWDKAIVEAIRNARFVLVFLSNNSVNKRGYVQTEIREALDTADRIPDGEIFIIPVRLEICTVPERLRKWQWIDVFRPNGFKDIVRILRTQLVSKDHASGPETTERVSSHSKDSLLDLLLLNKFQARDAFLYGRITRDKMAMSDSAFLEFRKRIPTSFMSRRSEVNRSGRLTPEIVSLSVPSRSVYKQKKYLVQQIRFMKSFNGAYILITEGDLRCAAGREYVDYILAKYPNGRLYVRGTNIPIIIEEDDKVCCALMPMLATSEELR